MSYADVLLAEKRIASYIHRTPVLTSSTIDDRVGRQVFFKCEHWQKTGSFKARGALNAVLKLKSEDPNSTGVITRSSGNHGQALAWAANEVGLPCKVVMSNNNTSSVKIEAIEGYGATVVFCEPNPVSRSETLRVSKEAGQSFIPSSCHVDVIAGQGTIATELLEQVPDLDAIMCSVCGGGMAAGIAIATKHIRPDTKVFVVEPKGKDLEPSIRTGERLWPNPPQYVDTIADGIRTQQLDAISFPIICQDVEKDVFTVSDEEIVEAMKFIWQRMKIVIEASAAATVAAVLSDKMKAMDPSIKKVGVILCGGNVDLDNLPW